MDAETEFKLITDFKALTKEDLERIALQLTKAYNNSTNLNSQASVKLALQADVINSLMAEVERSSPLLEGAEKIKKAFSFWVLYSMLTTVGILAMFILVLFK
ncbi:MAG: hypothetical protein KME47_09620 [Nodosilinea sp. WJT8-NPBG4]|jgi:hypothetical protein|nr:hypothetical protein [Nodosilinea sp. WJT8-NPBG4]